MNNFPATSTFYHFKSAIRKTKFKNNAVEQIIFVTIRHKNHTLTIAASSELILWLLRAPKVLKINNLARNGNL